MLKLDRRCVIADEGGRPHEFRVLSDLGGGELLLLAEQDADVVCRAAAAGAQLSVVQYLHDHVVGLDPRSGQFLTALQLKKALRDERNPLLRLVSP